MGSEQAAWLLILVKLHFASTYRTVSSMLSCMYDLSGYAVVVSIQQEKQVVRFWVKVRVEF